MEHFADDGWFSLWMMSALAGISGLGSPSRWSVKGPVLLKPRVPLTPSQLHEVEDHGPEGPDHEEEGEEGEAEDPDQSPVEHPHEVEDGGDEQNGTPKHVHQPKNNERNEEPPVLLCIVFKFQKH